MSNETKQTPLQAFMHMQKARAARKLDSFEQVRDDWGLADALDYAEPAIQAELVLAIIKRIEQAEDVLGQIRSLRDKTKDKLLTKAKTLNHIKANQYVYEMLGDCETMAGGESHD